MNFITILHIVCVIPIIVCQTVPESVNETIPESFADSESIVLKIDEYTPLKSNRYPSPYPRGTKSWIVESGEGGFGIEVIVKAFDLNSESGDYVLLQPGAKDDKQEPAKLLTWKFKEEKKYRLHHLDYLYIEFAAKGILPHKHSGFEIWLKSIGDIPTTTEPPTTEDPSILRPLSTSILYLRGQNVTTFYNQSLDSFREELIWMAEDYCDKHNITVETNISTNVNFHLVSTCPLDWYDYENCVLIKYSIPVNSENLTHGYELTSEHLDDMWRTYNKEINIEPLLPFFPPDYQSMMMGWIWISIGVFIAFVVFLYLFRRYNCFDDYISPILIQEDVERKKSNASLFPTPHQILPPLIGSDSYPPDEKTWMSYLPPEYSEKPPGLEGEINLGFDDEIIMSLEDSMDHKTQLTRRSVDTVEAFESTL